jgi:hypothetical protein
MPIFPFIPEQTPAVRPLRLVVPAHGPGIDEARSRHAVLQENRAAADFAASNDPRADADLRRIFSMRVAASLEGGRAAILTPDSRRRLVTEARRAGLRAFEANLIIALVQDGARRGLPPHARETDRLLDMIPSSRQREERQLLVQRLIVAGILAAGILVTLVRWVTGQ